MGTLITALLFFVAALVLAILRAARPRFRFSWLLALAATVAAWLSVLIMRVQLPSQLDVPLWRSSSSMASYATFTVGSITWPYIFGIATAAVTFLLSAPARPRFPTPARWAVYLGLAGLGVLALAADGPLTLVLFWAALDLAEAGLLLARLEKGSSSLQVPYAFTMRLGSIGLVLMAFVLGGPGSAGARFVDMESPMAVALLQTAALLRLWALAIPWPKNTETGPDDVGSMLQLTGGAVSVAFLSQLTNAPAGGPLLIVCAVTTLVAGWMFLRAMDSLAARPIWILGIGSLAVAASLLGNPVGAAGWGCAILLVGSPLYANSMVERWAKRALLLGLWIASALPFSLTAAAWQSQGGGGIWIAPVLLVGQATLLAGMFHETLRSPAGAAIRKGLVALKGLQYSVIGFPLLVGVVLGFWGWPGARQIGAPLAGLLVVPLAIALVWAKRRLPALSPGAADWLPTRLGTAAVSVRREASQLGVNLQRLAEAATRTMEGEAGIMWGLLFLVLFVSLIAGGNR